MSTRKRPLSGLRARAAVALFDLGWPIRRIALALRSSSSRVQDAIRASLAILVIVAGLSIVARSQGIAVPNTFVNGTSADAAAVNANFSALAAGALNRTGGTMTGTLNSLHVLPTTDATYDLGDGTHQYRNVYLSGAVIGGSTVPAHAVMTFNLSSCPSGWTEYTAARGRYVVGLPSGGTLAGTSGTALSDLEARASGQHAHTGTVSIIDSGHAHTVPRVTAGGGATTMFERTTDGSASENVSTSSVTTGITATTTINNSGSVAGTNAPYVQFLVCEKS